MNKLVQQLKRGVSECLFGCTLLVVMAGSAVANDAADEQAAADTPVAEGSEDSAQESAQETEPQKKFEPTEEISEDLSIPFPVDI